MYLIQLWHIKCNILLLLLLYRIRPYQLDDDNIVAHGERNPIETIKLI